MVARRRVNNETASDTMSRYIVAIATAPKQGKKAKVTAEKARKLFDNYIKGLTTDG